MRGAAVDSTVVMVARDEEEDLRESLEKEDVDAEDQAEGDAAMVAVMGDVMGRMLCTTARTSEDVESVIDGKRRRVGVGGSDRERRTIRE